MIRGRIVTKGREYEVGGVKKNEWNSIGKVVFFPSKDGKDAGFIVELNNMPGFYEVREDSGERVYRNPVVVFLDKPKEDSQPQKKVETFDTAPNFGGEIKEEDIAGLW